MEPKEHRLDHGFLGPKGEQRAFLQETISLVLDDYIFWRKNYYPKDPPGILYRTLLESDALEFREKFTQKLAALTSDLKLEVPFFSPRYFAHITSELSLPGLIAYFSALLYNPNNVSTEASSVTTAYELEVGRQFARLFGFDVDKSFGHLTSGGTVANYEAVWYARAAKYLPLSMALALRAEGLRPLPELSRPVWELLNVHWAELELLLARFRKHVSALGQDSSALLRKYSIGSYGERGFAEAVSEHLGESFQQPVILLPATAHYCWRRALSLFGIGQNSSIKISTDSKARVDPSDLERQLKTCVAEKRAVLLTVGVVGNTEFGTIDPIDDVVFLRDRFASQGLFSPVHIDAAFGGYFATMFQPGSEATLSSKTVNLDGIAKSYGAIGRCESVTVDPHKMGYVPYGAGAIVHKYGFLKELVTEPAPYALDDSSSQKDSLHLGKYILEGSKPGAAAASVWFTHQMIPLNVDGFGAHLFSLCELAQEFYRKMESWRLKGEQVELIPLFAPETNVLVFAVVPKRAKGLGAVNRITRQFYQRFGVKEVTSIQSYDYLVSHTRISSDSPLLDYLKLSGLERSGETGLEVIRVVIMNRWLSGTAGNGVQYIDDFLAAAYREAEELIYSV